MSILDAVRPAVRAMAGYTPGEQPSRPLIKLNTNENPYPPPRPVIEAIAAAVDRLRLYPEPTSRPVREAAARAYGLKPEKVVAGNGSDDLLTMIMRVFVGPGEVVAVPDPTYSLYRTLTEIQGGRYIAIPWLEGDGLPVEALAATKPKVVFVTRPNSPTGHAVPLDQVRALCRRVAGAVVLDEAYADFARDNGLPLLAECPNLIVTRTFSKSLSLAGLRIGLGFMAEAVAEQLHKVRDSYNLDMLAQAAAVAALERLDLFDPAIEAILAQRTRLTEALAARGFIPEPSEANFVLAAVPPGARDGAAWLRDLRAEGVLVRHFNHPALADKLRITVGAPHEMDALLAAIDRLQRKE